MELGMDAFNIQSSPRMDGLDPVTRKIRAFAQLPDGWDFGGGTPPTAFIVDKALALYSGLRRFGLNADAFPIADGGVSLTFYSGEHSFEILVNAEETMDLVHEVGIGVEYDQVEYREAVDLAVVEATLERYAGWANIRWTSSEPSVSNGIMIHTSDASRAVASPSPAVLSQYLDVSALRPRLHLYACT
jgi:hypothetical protein